MDKFILTRFLLAFSAIFFVLPEPVAAVMPSNPASDKNFMSLPDGRDLRNTTVKGVKLYLTKGRGVSFTSAAQTKFRQIVQDSKAKANFNVQWVLMDLDSHQVIDQSAEANRKIFGASVAKIFTASALLDKKSGRLSNSQFQLMADMLVVSSNTAWTNLQSQIGDGDSNLGRQTIQAFTQRMGYLRTRGWQGYWGSVHGNELTAAELGEFLYDTYKSDYPGAEIVWKLMHTMRTGGSRALKYLPANIFAGGKTGTYDGPTVNPETGGSKKPDGSPYTVKVRNQIVVFNLNGREYGLTILADTGSDESAAVLAGGLFRELTRR